MKTITYIIGYRWTCDTDMRLFNLNITLDWLINLKCKLKNNDINLVIVVVEQDMAPRFNTNSSISKMIEYIFLYNDGFYNRGWGFNVGCKSFDSDYYFFADGDILLKEENMITIFNTCFDYEAVNPYQRIYDSTEEYMSQIDNINQIVLDTHFGDVFTERSNTCFSGGVMGICHSAMNLINGWDERFRGRGWEDYAFTAKIELFLYKSHTYSYDALHLWHPYETTTTRTINESLNSAYENYNFSDYFNLIRNYEEYGSPVKYAVSLSVKCDSVKNTKYISDDRYYFAKRFFMRLFRKYGSNRSVYLYLCGQLGQLNDNQQISESGSCIRIPI